jgi:hypothetical protein
MKGYSYLGSKLAAMEFTSLVLKVGVFATYNKI